MCPHEEEGQQKDDHAAFNPDGYEKCLVAAQDNFVRIVNELMVRRKRLDLKQRQVAIALDMSPSRISEIECMNNTDVSLMRILLICQSLGARLEFRITDVDHGLFGNPTMEETATPQASGGGASGDQPSIGHRGEKAYFYLASLQSTTNLESELSAPDAVKTASVEDEVTEG